MAHTLSRVGYKHVCDPTVNIPFQAVVRTIKQWEWILLGVRDLIGLPLPHTVKTLTALWAKESLGSAVSVRKRWSQAQISRMRTFYFELMPVEVWKILHGCWLLQLPADLNKSHHCVHSQGMFKCMCIKGHDDPHIHTHHHELRKATAL